jgi:hypothetical protein
VVAVVPLMPQQQAMAATVALAVVAAEGEARRMAALPAMVAMAGAAKFG